VRYVEKEVLQLAQVKEDIQILYVPSSRVQIMQELVGRAGVQATVEARDEVKVGFVAVGTMAEYDARLSQRLMQVQRASESRIAHILFGE
jgi:hypothetical protein